MSDPILKISIADREYPLNVRSGQEALMIKAADLINTRLKDYASHYNITDKQDLLAMCSLEMTTKYFESVNRNKAEEPDELEQKLKEMEQFISQYLAPF
jgi:cell division protein ZapA (FtsZ GTPase activity inhibitor)